MLYFTNCICLMQYFVHRDRCMHVYSVHIFAVCTSSSQRNQTSHSVTRNVKEFFGGGDQREWRAFRIPNQARGVDQSSAYAYVFNSLYDQIPSCLNIHTCTKQINKSLSDLWRWSLFLVHELCWDLHYLKKTVITNDV